MAEDYKKILERLEKLEAENASLKEWKSEKEKLAEESMVEDMLNAPSDVQAMEERDRYAADHKHDRPLVLVTVNAPYVDSKSKKKVTPKFTGKTNECPWCNEREQDNLLDVTSMGRWACRTCGKHWYEEALGKPYSKEMERYFRTGATQENPVRFMKNGRQIQPDAAEAMKAMQEQINLLKTQLESKNGHKEEVKK